MSQTFDPEVEERLHDEASGARAVDGAELLDEVLAFLDTYVADSSLCTLWCVHTHAFDAADASPRLALLSAEPQSGKTRYLEVLKLVVRDPLFAVNVSEAALFRVVAARRPTILHDEVGAVFGPKARDREDLRGMLNAGYERGATVARCVGEGSKLSTKEFAVFTPVALAGIGRLPETIEQRSIVVRMKRRTSSEPVARLRRRKVAPVAEVLRRRTGRRPRGPHLPRPPESERDRPRERPCRPQDRAAPDGPFGPEAHLGGVRAGPDTGDEAAAESLGATFFDPPRDTRAIDDVGDPPA